MSRLHGSLVALALAVGGALGAQDAPTPPFSTNDDGQPRPAAKTPPPRKEAVLQLLDASGSVADVALAAAAFPLAPPSSGPVRVVVALETGRRQILPDSLAIGVRVLDARGEVAFNGTDEATVAPAAPDVATPLHYTVEVHLRPGRYRLRAAVVDGVGRQAAVDHPFVVLGPDPAEPLRAGALMIGHAPVGGSLRPLARSDVVRAGAVAWVDTADAAPAGGRLDVRDGESGATLADAAATVDPAGPGESRVVRAVMPVMLLPPGRYEARLAIETRGRRLSRSRPFTLGRLPPPEPSAIGEIVTAAVGPFVVADVLDPRVLAPVLTRALDVDPTGDDAAMRGAIATLTARGIAGVSLRPFAKRKDLAAQMLRGASLLQQGALEEAAGCFRDALRASSEFLPAIVYLGACYAAGGRDREAVGAWQTALVTETGSPLVFRLAADGLVRLGDSAQALSLLEEASERWPEETPLVRRHALAVAAREGVARAVDALLPALEQAQALDADLLALATRLAVVSAARGDDGSAARIARVRAVAERAGPLPPLLARWDAHLTQK
jgi:hypothetical protein